MCVSDLCVVRCWWVGVENGCVGEGIDYSMELWSMCEGEVVCMNIMILYWDGVGAGGWCE